MRPALLLSLCLLFFAAGCTTSDLTPNEHGSFASVYRKELELLRDATAPLPKHLSISNQDYWQAYFQGTSVIALAWIEEHEICVEDDDGNTDYEYQYGWEWYFTPRDPATGEAEKHVFSQIHYGSRHSRAAAFLAYYPPWVQDVTQGGITFGQQQFNPIYVVAGPRGLSRRKNPYWPLIIVDATKLHAATGISPSAPASVLGNSGLETAEVWEGDASVPTPDP